MENYTKHTKYVNCMPTMLLGGKLHAVISDIVMSAIVMSVIVMSVIVMSASDVSKACDVI